VTANMQERSVTEKSRASRLKWVRRLEIFNKTHKDFEQDINREMTHDDGRW
jgi:hypothetical protein